MNTAFDPERARFNMVEQQIRPWDVLDQRVLSLLFKVRREEFVPQAHRALAFADLEIPLGHGEIMLQPKFDTPTSYQKDVELVLDELKKAGR